MDKLIDEILKGCEHDGSYIPVTEVKRLMQSYHEVKLKEELIEFENWRRDKMPRTFATTSYVINEYLKTRNNGLESD